MVLWSVLACAGAVESGPIWPVTTAETIPADTGGADPQHLYIDADGDGFGDVASEEGTAAIGGDCDDADATVYPGAAEVCGDGQINDCDGALSEAAALCGLSGDVPLREGLSGADGSRLGAAVAAAGDVDGDGTGDLLMGAPEAGGGAVYIAAGGSLSMQDAWMSGGAPGDELGAAVDGAGDVNGDGYADVIVGAPGEDTGAITAGSAVLLLGPLSGAVDVAHATLLGEASVDNAGCAVSGVVDADGDGRSDLLVGAYGSDAGGSAAGAAYLVLGGVSGTVSLTDAHARLVGTADADYAGAAVDDAGDVDGDGRSDLLISAHGSDAGGSFAGAAYLVLGGVSGTVSLADAHAHLIGEASNDRAGSDVAGVGDVDGDGHADLLIGGYGSSTGGSFAGGAWLVRGPVSGVRSLSTADAALIGEDSGDYAGAAVSAAGDIDGDGLSDLLIGAHHDSAGASHAGGAFVLSGPLSGTVSLSDARVHLLGEAADDGAGAAVSAAGDIDGDGLSDLLIGAPAHAGGGAVYLIQTGGY